MLPVTLTTGRLLFIIIVENIRDAPPRPEEWWQRAGPDIDVYEEDEQGNINAKVIICPRTNSRRKKFRNCGLETWLKAREEWQQRTVESVSQRRPTPSEHSQLVKGLAKASTLRTYELPRRMVLSDLIDVYQDIWDGEGL